MNILKERVNYLEVVIIGVLFALGAGVGTFIMNVVLDVILA